MAEGAEGPRTCGRRPSSLDAETEPMTCACLHIPVAKKRHLLPEIGRFMPQCLSKKKVTFNRKLCHKAFKEGGFFKVMGILFQELPSSWAADLEILTFSM